MSGGPSLRAPDRRRVVAAVFVVVMLALGLATAVRAAPITTLGMCAYYTLSPQEEQFIAPRVQVVGHRR